MVVKICKDGPLTKLTGIWFLKYGLIDNTYSEERFQIKGATRSDWTLLDGTTIFKSYEDFLEKARENQSLAFVLSVTHISKEMFDYAEKHPDYAVPISIDIVKYLKWLKEPDSAAIPQSMAKDKRAEFKAATKRFILKNICKSLAGYKAIVTTTTEVKELI